MRHRKLSGRHTEVMRRMSSSMLLSVFSLFLLTLYLIFSLSSLRNSCFLLLLFCPSACCCADGSPEHIHVSSKNISSLRLFTRRSVSALPVSPSRPPVITIVTYGSATPSPFTKRVFLSEFEQQSLLFVSICVRIYANAHLVGLFAYIIARLHSCYLLHLSRPSD